MDNFDDKIEQPRRNIWAGLFLVAAGSLYLASKMGAPFPSWLFTWPVLLIAIGIFTGIKKRFRDFSWLILVVIGGLFLAEKFDWGFSVREYIIPIVIILIGISFMFKPKYFDKNDYRCRSRRWQRWEAHHRYYQQHEPEVIIPEKKNSDETIDKGELLDSVSVFGAVRKKIVSKNFAGGEVTCFMGGAEIDLSQADIQGQVVLDITQVFGGTKLIIPSHWDLKAELAAVFGGVEDKRMLQGTAVDLNKVLILKGTSVFGGIDIQSY